MSVINQMLRDLDARRAPQATSVTGAPSPVQTHRSPRSFRLPLIVLVGGVAIGAMAVGDWPGWLTSRANAATAAAAAPLTDGAGVLATPTPMPMPMPMPMPIPMPMPMPMVATPPPKMSVPPPQASVAPARAPLPSRDVRDETLALRTPPAVTAVPNFLSAPTLPATGAAQPLPTVATGPASIDKKMMSLTPDQRAQAAYRMAVDAANAGHPQQAAERAIEALQQAPQHRAARHLAAVLLHAQGATGRAIALLNEGLAIDPEHGALALLLARLQLEHGAPDAALEVLDRFKLHHAEAEGLRAGILAQQGDFKRSLGAYESALRQQPGNATWWLGLGVALESEGRASQARHSYAKAQALGLDRDELTSFVEQRLRALD